MRCNESVPLRTARFRFDRVPIGREWRVKDGVPDVKIVPSL